MLSLVYISRATEPFSDNDVAQLLHECHQKNAAHGVTGMLLMGANNRFIQAIEGPEDAVEVLFEKIRLDPRHNTVLCIGRREINEREFPGWQMGFQALQELESRKLAELEPDENSSSGSAEKTLSYAMRMLLHFRDTQTNKPG